MSGASFTSRNGMNFDKVTQLDMSISTKHSSRDAIRTLMKQICLSTVPTCRYAKQHRQTSPSTHWSPKALLMTSSGMRRKFMRHTFRNQNVLCGHVEITGLGVLVISTGGG